MKNRNPTMIAKCGCPYDPEYDADSLGWHLAENHIPELSPETQLHVRLTEQAGCKHPPYYIFDGAIVEGYCKLCRNEHVKHDPAWGEEFSDTGRHAMGTE